MNSRITVPERSTVTLGTVDGDLIVGRHATVKGQVSRQQFTLPERFTAKATTTLNAHCQPQAWKPKAP